ncbi:MAG: DUF6152 family protein [Dechloromonas sp.]|nr:DUF6152 family protein [Dechloromonas sp.]
MKKQLGVLAVLAGSLFASSPMVQAHHAFAAEFDGDQPVEIKGVVTKGKWVNPHSWLYVDVKDNGGAVTNWGFEFGSPYSLQEKGLTRDVLQPGAEVTIKGFRSKSGKPYAYAVTVTLADGRVFKTGGAQDAPGG